MKRNGAFTMMELLFVVAIIAVLAAISVPNFLEAQIRSKTARARTDMAVVAAALQAYFADYNRYPPNSAEVRDLLIAYAQYDPESPAPMEEAAQPPSTPAPFAPWMQSGVTTPTLAAEAGFRNPFPTPGAIGAATSPPLANAVAPPGTIPLGKSGYSFYPGYGFGYGYAPPATYQAPPPYPTEALLVSGWSLTALTTPVAYFTRALPTDPFYTSNISGSRFRDAPFQYFNLDGVLDDDSPTTAGGPGRAYLLLSPGPDSGVYYQPGNRPGGAWNHPVYGPLISYDPTNGTVSVGDLYVMGG